MLARYTKKTILLFSSYYKKIELDCPTSFKYDELITNISRSGMSGTIDIKTLAFGQHPTDHMISVISKNGVW